MVKAITFDLDGVYFTEAGKQGFNRRLTEAHGINRTQDFMGSEVMQKAYLGQVDSEGLTVQFNQFFGTNYSPDELMKYWVQDYQVDEEVKRIIQTLKGRNIQVCACSNNFKLRIDALQNRFSFLDDFDVIVFSFEVGVRKPDEKIFKELISKTGYKPEEIFYSDDNPERLSGAKTLGIQTHEFVSIESFLAKLRQIGVEI